jgi:hypothetical protein
MRARSICLVLLFAIPAAQADEQLRATQEELRRRNLYFGNIDGRQTQELGEALKRFQRRKGYSGSGEVDSPTLRLLGLAPRDAQTLASREESLPDEPVLRSDIQINPTAEARAVARETGISVSELDPIASTSIKSISKRHLATPGRGGGLTRAPQTRGVGLRDTPVNRQTQWLDPAQLAPLVRGYLKAAEGHHTRDEIRFFADHVDYLGHGVMDRRVIERTLRAYHLRWPSRDYNLVGPVQYRRDAARGVYVVSCTVEFTLKRGRVKARGLVLNRFVFDAATSDPRIIAVSEARVRE